MRVARVEGGQLAIGRSLAGRGAWLCRASVIPCLDAAVRRKALGRALRAELAPDAVTRLRGYAAERARL